jgi:SnoaL-like domain
MLTEAEARKFAEHWITAWNSHDIEAVLSHYGPAIVLTSPVAAKLFNDPSGTLVGIHTLRNYFKRGLEIYPQLRFELLDVLWGITSVVLYYRNQVVRQTGEFMELDASRKVLRVVANYSS